VAYFGQQLGKHQIDLLRRRRISELVLMPDGTDPKARARALKDAATLAARFPSVVVALLEGGDPDESPRAVVETALARAKAPEGFTTSLRERLKNTRDTW
jgi:DNA primase